MQHKVELEVIQTDDVAELTVAGYTFSGDSKRHPKDKVDRKIGRDVAVGRVLLTAAITLLRDGEVFDSTIDSL